MKNRNKSGTEVKSQLQFERILERDCSIVLNFPLCLLVTRQHRQVIIISYVIQWQCVKEYISVLEINTLKVLKHCCRADEMRKSNAAIWGEE